MTRSPLLAAKRLAQTISAFDNGGQVLWDITRHAGELTVRTKQGLTITCPNVAGARVPLFELFAEDTYEIDSLLSGLPADLVVLDIGGHIGCFSTSLALAAPAAQVHAFEASSGTADFLERNIAQNGMTGRVHAHRQALSDHHGTITFASSVLGGGLNGMTSPDAATNVVEVPCITFAEAVAEAGGRVDLVKMDVEGAEYPIVLGSRPADWAGVKRVVMEFHGVPGKHWHELRDFFVEAGLTLTRHDHGSEGYGMLWLDRP
jgi:FkbM family methyltransferase